MSSRPPISRLQAVLLLLLATVLWGLSFPVIKAIMLLQQKNVPQGGTWFVTACALGPRFVLGAVILALFRPVRFWQFTPGELKQGLVMGLFASGGMLFQIDGMQFTSASTSAFLTQFCAIMIPVYLAVRHRRNPGWLVWVSCGLVLAGVAILGRFDWSKLRFGRGEWETLLGTVFFTGQILWLDKKEFAANRAGKITLLLFAVQGLVFGTVVLATAPAGGALPALWAAPGWLELTLVLTLVCTLGPFGIMNSCQPRITATEAGLIYCAEPIFASAAALFLPAWLSLLGEIEYSNEEITRNLLIGGSLITIANVLIQLKPPAKP